MWDTSWSGHNWMDSMNSVLHFVQEHWASFICVIPSGPVGLRQNLMRLCYVDHDQAALIAPSILHLLGYVLA